MQAKTIATLFETFQRFIWDAPDADYDIWADATETAKTLGGKFTEIDEDYLTVTFSDGSYAIIGKNGAEIRETFEPA